MEFEARHVFIAVLFIAPTTCPMLLPSSGGGCDADAGGAGDRRSSKLHSQPQQYLTQCATALQHASLRLSLSIDS